MGATKMSALVLGLCWASGLAFSSTELLDTFVRGHEKFNAAVYQQLRNTKDGNFLASPLALEIIVALVGAGARGATASEIRKSLRLPNDQDVVNSIFSMIVPSLRGASDYNLTTANRIFVNRGIEVDNNYRDLASRSYRSGIEDLDFNDSQWTARRINHWVETHTNGKIRYIIGANDISYATSLVLVNTIYFNANWFVQFVPIPRKQPFYVGGHDAVAVDMMSVTGSFDYLESEELGCQVIELPYADERIRLVIALPTTKFGLSALEDRIGDLLRRNVFVRERVYVQLPKFSTETTVEFTEILKNLGIKKAFTDAADFSGIDAGLKISRVVQKTFINLTESGTEAAAAAGVYALPISAIIPDEPKQFIADHPFVYFILAGDLVLFVGRYSTGSN